MTNIEIPFLNIPAYTGTNTSYTGSFVHFKSKKTMKRFKKDNSNNYMYGHHCCSGKGLMIMNIVQKDAIEIERKYYDIDQKNYDIENRQMINVEKFECGVCYDNCIRGDVAEMNCQHLFCKNCINQIKNKTNLANKCPICRTSLPI